MFDSVFLQDLKQVGFLRRTIRITAVVAAITITIAISIVVITSTITITITTRLIIIPNSGMARTTTTPTVTGCTNTRIVPAVAMRDRVAGHTLGTLIAITRTHANTTATTTITNTMMQLLRSKREGWRDSGR